jgi:hypothetical protein
VLRKVLLLGIEEQAPRPKPVAQLDVVVAKPEVQQNTTGMRKTAPDLPAS